MRTYQQRPPVWWWDVHSSKSVYSQAHCWSFTGHWHHALTSKSRTLPINPEMLYSSKHAHTINIYTRKHIWLDHVSNYNVILFGHKSITKWCKSPVFSILERKNRVQPPPAPCCRGHEQDPNDAYLCLVELKKSSKLDKILSNNRKTFKQMLIHPQLQYLCSNK